MRVLVSTLSIQDRNFQTVTPEIARLDRFSNGLLSRAINHGLFQERKKSKKTPDIEAWCYLRPRFQSCGALMLWTEDKKVDWETLQRIHPNAEFLLDSEAFTEADLKKAQSFIGEERTRLWPNKGEVD
jgi:hypothetical protein